MLQSVSDASDSSFECAGPLQEPLRVNGQHTLLFHMSHIRNSSQALLPAYNHRCFQILCWGDLSGVVGRACTNLTMTRGMSEPAETSDKQNASVN